MTHFGWTFPLFQLRFPTKFRLSDDVRKLATNAGVLMEPEGRGQRGRTVGLRLPSPRRLSWSGVAIDSRQKFDERAIDHRRFDKVGRDEGGLGVKEERQTE